MFVRFEASYGFTEDGPFPVAFAELTDRYLRLLRDFYLTTP